MAKVTLYDVLPALVAEAAADALGEIAGDIANDARAAVPVESGEWKSGISSEKTDLYGLVTSSDPESFYKEYGTSDTPAHMALTNAARKYGKYTGMTGRGR